MGCNMRVGICYTKNKSDAVLWTAAFHKGVLAAGDEAVEILHPNDALHLSRCDCTFQVCAADFSSSYESNFRRNIQSRSKQAFILDVGVIKSGKDIPFKERYASIYLNNIKQWGVYWDHQPSDRWQKLNIKTPEWRKDGSHILVLGQTPHGAGITNIPSRNILSWSNATLKTIRQFTDRKIIYKAHPTQTTMPQPVENCEMIGRDFGYDLTQLLSGAWCTVASASNGACDSIMAGVPVITDNSMSLAYEVAEHDLKNIERPRTPCVRQWCNNIAYAQWKIDEMKSGEAWNFIKDSMEYKKQ